MAINEKTETEVILCEACNGAGTLEHKELEDYHRGEYRYWDTICKKCNGAGRLRKTVITQIKIEPYENPVLPELMFEKLKSEEKQAK